jgi:hypothetical protein
MMKVNINTLRNKTVDPTNETMIHWVHGSG